MSKSNERGSEKVTLQTINNRTRRIQRHLKKHPNDLQSVSMLDQTSHTTRSKPNRNSPTVIKNVPGRYALVLSNMKNRLNSESKKFLQHQKLFKAMEAREKAGLPKRDNKNMKKYQKALYAW